MTDEKDKTQQTFEFADQVREETAPPEERPGYKKTQLGWIPVDWEVVKIKEISQIQTGFTKNSKDKENPIAVPYLRVANVQEDFIDLTEVKEAIIPKHKLDRYRLQTGDVLLTEGGDFDKLGRGAVWNGVIDPCIHQNHVFAVRINQELLLPYFFSNLCSSSYGKRYFLSCAKQTTNLASINLTQLKAFPLPLPPKPEQEKIAQILATWDWALGAVEKLITRREEEKKGLMERLLTGQVRFPEFVRSSQWKETKLGKIPEDWDVVKLGEVAEVISSNVDKKTKADETPVKLCNYTDVYYNNYIDKQIDFMEATASFREIEKYKIEYGDVIITKDSESPDDIAIPSLVIEDFSSKVICAYHLTILRPSKVIAGGYLAKFLEFKRVRHYFFTLANGVTRFGLTLPSIRGADVLLPPKAEQEKIAQVLNACDRRLEALRRKRDALREEKKGLMEKLLTGQIRVTI